jgi:hypothetical protein
MAEKVDPELCKKCGYRGTPLCTHPTGEYREDDKDLLKRISKLQMSGRGHLYHGWKDPDDDRCVLVARDNTTLDPKPSQKLYNHSPDGFNWGYHGSAPAQLALAILFDVTEDANLSIRLHQLFKDDFVAGWGSRWETTTQEVKAWVATNMPADWV